MLVTVLYAWNHTWMSYISCLQMTFIKVTDATIQCRKQVLVLFSAPWKCILSCCLLIYSLEIIESVIFLIRNCEIKSVAPYGVLVEIAPGRDVHIFILNFQMHNFWQKLDDFTVTLLLSFGNINFWSYI